MTVRGGNCVFAKRPTVIGWLLPFGQSRPLARFWFFSRVPTPRFEMTTQRLRPLAKEVESFRRLITGAGNENVSEPLKRILSGFRFSFKNPVAASGSSLSHVTHFDTNTNSQNGRHVRRRPRPQQGPRGLHRQGRQHQLHDGVAAPRQQVRSGFSCRARFPGFFCRFSRDERQAIGARTTRCRAIALLNACELYCFDELRVAPRFLAIALDARILCRLRLKG